MRRSNVPSKRPLSVSCINKASTITVNKALDADVISNPTVFKIVWRKKQSKKHKTWENDGFIIISNSRIQLLDLEGKEITNQRHTSEIPEIGQDFIISNYEVQATDGIPYSDYSSGKCFINNSTPEPALRPLVKFKSSKPNHLKSTIDVSLNLPRHDPNVPNALVMPRINSQKQIPVVVDPHLSAKLRPHQRQGISFLYECVMGLRDYQGTGAILADEMGLGKTIQTIALIWTLMKQTPFPNQNAIVKKALVVCPASLVLNWKKEFKKWLGEERVRVFAVDIKSNLNHFIIGRSYSVMIIGYERLRTCIKEICAIPFDIAIFDEGHRLKNTRVQITQAIVSLQCKKRIILSGTPLQNDMQEFFTMVDIVNPGCLGSLTSFKRLFEDPIVKGRDPEAKESTKYLGQERSEELSRMTNMFVLRRTSEVNNQYLPPKLETILFIRPNEFQKKLYKNVLNSGTTKGCISNFDKHRAQILSLILILRKIANSPRLVLDDSNCLNSIESLDINLELEKNLIKNNEKLMNGSKFDVLICLLKQCHIEKEKIVIVSNWTKTLDLVAEICKNRGYLFNRLDGKTPMQHRQTYVDEFNRNPEIFAFLLSCKAGGVGLNLIGASRLILLDIDWNPSTCQQAMARIWRDGQKKPVRIYRFLTTGTIDEKIYQRQLSKLGLSDNLFNEKPSADETFMTEDLKDIFVLKDTDCETHNISGCKCMENLDFEKEIEGDIILDEEDGWIHLSEREKDRCTEWQIADSFMTDAVLETLFKNVSFAYFKES